MRGSKNGAKENAEATNGNVGNSKEGILAAHDGAGGDEDRLGALVFRHGKV